MLQHSIKEESYTKVMLYKTIQTPTRTRKNWQTKTQCAQVSGNTNSRSALQNQEIKYEGLGTIIQLN